MVDGSKNAASIAFNPNEKTFAATDSNGKLKSKKLILLTLKAKYLKFELFKRQAGKFLAAKPFWAERCGRYLFKIFDLVIAGNFDTAHKFTFHY